MKIIEGGVVAPQGFSTAGIFCGLKKNKKDLGLIFSDRKAIIAGSYTQNIVKAAPLLWSKTNMEKNPSGRAILVNSGNANACTGKQGELDVLSSAKLIAKLLNTEPEEVYVASTGVVGVPLPIDILLKGCENIVPLLDNSVQAGNDISEAIMTTDTFNKQIAVEIICKGKKVKIGGISKGSGMIHPNMATMLAFVTTDINISQKLLQEMLTQSVDNSYNMISVDGDTSTNDMIVVMANAAAENTELTAQDEDFGVFKKAFEYVNTYLAKEIARDGEGATKFLEVKITQANSEIEAKKLAKSVVGSSLVKAAMFGQDANWGRCLVALGYAGVNFDQTKVSIEFTSNAGNILLFEKGTPIIFDENKASKILQEKFIQILVYMDSGSYEATAWGCDLSFDYVKINGSYRS